MTAPEVSVSTLAPTLTPAAAPPEGAPLPLLLLRDDLAIDRAIGDVRGATRMLVPLTGLVVLGFAAHALTVLATAWPSLGPVASVRIGGAWFVATTVGFFAAICAGLPSYWFYGIVADIRAPAWRLAAELVRIQAVGAVVLFGILPFWLTATLGLHLAGVDVMAFTPWMLVTWAMPFLGGAVGLGGLYRSFARMRAANGEAGWLPALLLTAWWAVLFLCTAPVTIGSLFVALAR